MKRAISMTIISCAALSLTACAPGQNMVGGTVVGALGGGFLGGAIFHGSFAGVVAGALIGGAIGNIVGQHMDRQDRINFRNAVARTPVNSEATWTNTRTDTTYVVRPVRNYRYHGYYCREYQTKVIIGGKKRSAYGRACRKPDGSWHIVR